MQELLGLLGLEGRLDLSWISSAEAQKFVQVVTDFTEKIRSLGPNPLTAFSSSRKAAAAELMQMDFKGDGYDQPSQSIA